MMFPNLEYFAKGRVIENIKIFLLIQEICHGFQITALFTDVKKVHHYGKAFQMMMSY